MQTEKTSTKKIWIDIGKISGIYKIINKENGKYYVGSSLCIGTPRGRWYRHFYNLNKNSHQNEYLQRAWNKHGSDSFDFLVVEPLENITKSDLLIVEQRYLDIAKQEPDKTYNMIFTAGGGRVSEQSIDKIRLAMTGKRHSEESKRKMSLFRKGKTFSEEHRRNMSMSLIGNKRNLARNRTNETKKRISASNKKHIKTFGHNRQDNNIYNFIKDNQSFIGKRVEFCKRYGICSSIVSRLVRQKIKSIFGWKIAFVGGSNSISQTSP